MLKQTDIPAEDQTEIFRIADKLYREDEEQRRNADASAAAAAELGVPQEYLDRAAQELHLQRLEAVKAKRKRLWIIPVIALTGISLTLIMTLTLSRAPTRISPGVMSTGSVTNVYDLSEAQVRANPGTKRSISATKSAATLQIEQFIPDENGDFYGNVLVSTGNIREVETVSASVAGRGIPNIRIDLEAGDVRWKGPVSSSNTSVSISAKEFQKQVRQGSGWKNTSWAPPSGKLRIAFKTGKSINDASTKGTLTVTNVELRAKQ